MNKAPLFGNKEILITADPNMTLEVEAKQNKQETVLMDRLKFLISIKKFLQEHHKGYLVDLINHIKQAQKAKEISEPVQALIDF